MLIKIYTLKCKICNILGLLMYILIQNIVQ